MRSCASRRAIAAITSIAFLSALALAASPQIHQRLHSDANSVDHVCAVTLVNSGKFDYTPVGLLIKAPVPLDEFKIPELTPLWVEPLFLLTSVYEHAPPANS